MSKQELKQKGFTIIEVVLVLAIAALIFLMVFIALPALQRNQRDASRKEIVGKVASAVTTYQSNKRGAQPTKGSDIKGYVDGVAQTGVKGETVTTFTSTANDTYVDNNYVVTVTSTLSTTGSADRNVIQVITKAKCNTTGDGAIAGSTRNAAILVKLENGDAYFCQDV
jgi:prepilin-type N-terminal cleavage/methylation domain-containing protein